MNKLPIAVLGMSAIVIVAGCGSSSSGSSTPKAPSVVASDAAGKAAATTQIKANWATFFNSKTPSATAVSLLQDGPSLTKAIAIAAKAAKAQKLAESAVVKTIHFTSSTQAAITYDLDAGGKALLPGADGTAILDGGKWKVSAQTFCSLVALAAPGKPIPNCK
jgi:outer membrane protein TolC